LSSLLPFVALRMELQLLVHRDSFTARCKWPWGGCSYDVSV